MLMRAVMESLKDLEVQSLENKEPPEKRVHGSNAFKTAQQSLLSSEVPTSTQANQSETDSASSPGDALLPSSSESNAPSETPASSSEKVNETGDISAVAKPTVTVERSSSSSKWDFNFFKNSK